MPQSVAMLKSRQLSSWSGVKKCFLAPYMRIILYIGKTPPALQDFCNYNAIAMQFLQYSTIKMYTVWGSKVPFQNYLQKHSNSGWNGFASIFKAVNLAVSMFCASRLGDPPFFDPPKKDCHHGWTFPRRHVFIPAGHGWICPRDRMPDSWRHSRTTQGGVFVGEGNPGAPAVFSVERDRRWKVKEMQVERQKPFWTFKYARYKSLKFHHHPLVVLFFFPAKHRPKTPQIYHQCFGVHFHILTWRTLISEWRYRMKLARCEICMRICCCVFF